MIRGVVAGVNYDGSAMFLGSATKAPGYLVPQNWEDMHGVWHESGHPDCALPLSSGARAELHVINVPATKDAPGFPDFAVRIRCLSRPTLVRKP